MLHPPCSPISFPSFMEASPIKAVSPCNPQTPLVNRGKTPKRGRQFRERTPLRPLEHICSTNRRRSNKGIPTPHYTPSPFSQKENYPPLSEAFRKFTIKIQGTPLPGIKEPESDRVPRIIADPFENRLNFPKFVEAMEEDGNDEEDADKDMNSRPMEGFYQNIDVQADMFPFELTPEDWKHHERICGFLDDAKKDGNSNTSAEDEYWRRKNQNPSPPPKRRRPIVLYDPSTNSFPAATTRAVPRTNGRKEALKRRSERKPRRTQSKIEIAGTRQLILPFSPASHVKMKSRANTTDRVSSSPFKYASLISSAQCFPSFSKEDEHEAPRSIIKSTSKFRTFNSSKKSGGSARNEFKIRDRTRSVHFEQVLDSGDMAEKKKNQNKAQPCWDQDVPTPRQLDFSREAQPDDAGEEHTCPNFDDIVGRIKEGDLTVSKVLSAFPNLTNKNHGGTVLMETSVNGKLSLVRTLIDSKADPNRKNKFDTTALMFAAYMNRPRIATMLIEAKADVSPSAVNKFGRNALEIASLRGSSQVIQVISRYSKTKDRTTSLNSKESIQVKK
eukprot:jgi/Bigna1/90346/estExt_fgenesh1_pg.C_670123